MSDDPWAEGPPETYEELPPWDEPEPPQTTFDDRTSEGPTHTKERHVSNDDTEKISITLKGGTGFDAPWIVVKGNSAAEAESILDEIIMSGLMKKTAQAASRFHSDNGASKPAASSGGGGAQRRNSRPQSNGAGKSCAHGEMRQHSGQSAKGPWTGYFCPLPKGDPDQCDPIFK